MPGWVSYDSSDGVSIPDFAHHPTLSLSSGMQTERAYLSPVALTRVGFGRGFEKRYR